MERSPVRRLVACTAVVVLASLSTGVQPAYATPVADAVGSVVGIETGGAFGTGFVTAEGVVTAAHVVEGASTVSVHAGGEVIRAEVARVDQFLDLALVEVEIPGAVPLPLDGDPELGEPVTVVAYDAVSGPVLTRGIVSALPVESGVELVQTDAAVNPGTSGGPVLGEDGRVLGLVITKDVFRDDVGHAHTADDLAAFLAAGAAGERRETASGWRDGEPVEPVQPLPPVVPLGVAGVVVALIGVGALRSRTPRPREDLSIRLGPVTAVEDPERPPT